MCFTAFANQLQQTNDRLSIESRKRNISIYRVPEKKTDSVAERKTNDAIFVKDLLDGVFDTKVEDCDVAKGIRNIRSQDYSFPGTFVPMMELSFSGPFIPWNFHSQDYSFPGTFVPWTVLSLELSFLGPFVPPGPFVIDIESCVEISFP